MSASLLIRSLERHARDRPHALAVREFAAGRTREIGWGELLARSQRVASRIARSAPAPVVLAAGPAGVDLLATLLGGLWAGAAVAPIAPELPPAVVAALAQRISATLASAPPRVLGHLAGVPVRLPLDGVSEPQGPAAEPGPSARGGALLLRSSGTTGPPRIVRREAPALDAVGESCRTAIGVGADDVLLITIPMHHSYGIDQALLTGVIAGCALELHDGFDPGRAKAALRRGVSVWPAVPLMLDALARTATGRARAPALRRVISAGSPLPARVFEAFQRVYGVSVGQLYGATEFGSITFNDPDDPDFRAESVGPPFAGVRVRILDPKAPDLAHPLARGREGQVAIASPSALSRYEGDPEPATRDGFVVTSDLGRLDARGRLTLTGRLQLLIDVGGHKVNPIEVEAALSLHPDVHEAVVLPVRYSDTVTRLKAVIIPEPGARPDVQSLRAFALERLIHYQVPRSFEIRREVPRSATGKILRQELLDGASAP